MPCMCGDSHCSSCGPAQGNRRCPLCGAWADEGCEHVDEETGRIKPEFEQAVREAVEAENKFWQALFGVECEMEVDAQANKTGHSEDSPLDTAGKEET
jgi:hypothetical protein